MKKRTLLFAAILLASTMLLAETIDGVKYLDANGTEQTANGVNVVTSATEQVILNGWYIVTGTNVTLSKGAICQGHVSLILADGAKLTVTGAEHYAGIEVSGAGLENSLDIYAQSTGDQMGQLVATGGTNAAGIGSGETNYGSNITINGGIVTANGGSNAAGIGGGPHGYAKNITINGGIVTANGSSNADGIGGGEYGKGYNIYVATDLQIKADGNNPPTTVIEHSSTTNLAPDLDGKQYVTIEFGLTSYKTAAIKAIDDAIENITDETILAIANTAKTNIGNATSANDIESIKTLAIAKISAIKAINDAIAGLTLFPAEKSYIDFIKSSIREDDEIYSIQSDKQLALDYIALHDAKVAAVAALKHDMGDYAESETIYHFIGGPAIETADDANKLTEAKNAALVKMEEYSQLLGDAATAGYNKGKAEAADEILGEMATQANGHAVVVSDGTTTVTLYNPLNVSFIKVEE